MKSPRCLGFHLLSIGAFALTITTGIAATGTWNVATSGNWQTGTTTNWNGGTIADGAGFTANFGTTINVDNNYTVTLVGARTIGNLVFGDNSGGTIRVWTITGSTLTLSSGSTPTISTGNAANGSSAIISSVLAGTQGFTTSGEYTVTLNAANTISGVVTNGGTTTTSTLALGNVDALQNATLNTGTSGSQLVTFTASGTNTYNLGGLQGADALAIGANRISVGANNTSTSYTGVLSGTGGLTKVGTGTLTLGGNNTYGGTTLVNAGTLVINGNQTTAGGNITVANGAKLQGGNTATTGAALTTIQSGGTLVAGLDFNNSGGTTSALTFNSGSIFEWDINAAGTFSLTDVEGAVTGSGAVFKILLTDFSNSAVWNMDKSWNLAAIFAPSNAVTLASIFSSVQSSGEAYGRGFYFSGGNLVWAAIPETSTTLVGILLAAGLLHRRRGTLSPTPA